MFQKSDLQFDEQDVHVYSPQEFRVNDEVIVFFIGRSIPGQIRQKNNRSGMMKVELHTSMWEERLVDVRAHTHLEPLLTQRWLQPREESSGSDESDDDSVSETQ